MHAGYHNNILMGKKQENCRSLSLLYVTMATYIPLLYFAKAMDQPSHVTRFLLYPHFSLYNPIPKKNKMGNWEFVELNKMH